MKQQPNFRSEEIKIILSAILAGECLSIVGASGVGKSNLFNHLLDPDLLKHHNYSLSEYIFLRVNCHFASEFTDRSLYSLILDAIELLDERHGINSKDKDRLSQLHDTMLTAGSDVMLRQRYFRKAVNYLLSKSTSSRLVLLLDQFESFYMEAEPYLFQNLRGLRESYKYRMVMICFTRDRLTDLAEMDSDREEFHELFAYNVLGLKPYSQRDADELLNRVSARLQISIQPELYSALYDLTGGHAGLHRALLMIISKATDKRSLVTPNQFLMEPDVQLECQKLWRGLAVAEQKLLSQLASGSSITTDEEALRSLQLKGLVTDNQIPTIFSPIFSTYILTHVTNEEPRILLDHNRRCIVLDGKTMSHLTAMEYKLASAFFESPNTILEIDELIDILWPKAQGNVDTNTLTAAIRRLRRKLEPNPAAPIFLETVREHGYRLNTTNSI